MPSGTGVVVYRTIMRFNNLSLLGFHASADKTLLSCRQGVTAIVGPNGCAKSYVSDAIPARTAVSAGKSQDRASARASEFHYRSAINNVNHQSAE